MEQQTESNGGGNMISRFLPILTSRKGLLPIAALFALLIWGGFFIYQKYAPRHISLLSVVNAGEGNVPVNADIKIAFPYKDAALEEIKKNFSAEPTIEGELRFEDGVLTIGHEKNLKYDTAYTVRINKDLSLGEDKALSQDFVFNFSTRKKAARRAINFNGYAQFMLYTLNYYDHDYEIEINPEVDGEYEVKAYKSSMDEVMKGYTDPPQYDEKSRRWIRNAATSTEIADRQDIKLTADRSESEDSTGTSTQAAPKKNIYQPKIDKVGIYFVEVKNKEAKKDQGSKKVQADDPDDEEQDYPEPEYARNTYFYLVVTKNAVMTKRLGDRLVTWVVDQKTSAGLPGAHVQALRGYEPREQEDEEGQASTSEKIKDSGQIISDELTDKDGMVNSTVKQDDYENNPRFLAVVSDEDIAFNFLSGDWSRDIYRQDYDNRLIDSKAFVYTDRPIYKPGDTVNFKAIVRDYDRLKYSVSSKDISMQVKNSVDSGNSAAVIEKKETLKEDGSVADSFVLSKEIKTGYYYINIKAGDEVLGSVQFSVEYYVKPDFEISAKTDKEKYLLSETVEAQISAQYLFGAPVKNAKVHWSLYNYDATFQEGDGKLDADGKIKIRIPTDEISFPSWWGWGYGGYIVNVGVDITDESGKSSSKNVALEFFDGEYRLSLEQPENIWNLKTKTKYDFKIKAADSITGKERAGVRIDYLLEKMNWDWTDEKEQKQQLAQGSATTDAPGYIGFSYSFEGSGSYTLTLTSKDSLGNEIKREEYFWVGDMDYGGAGSDRKTGGQDQIIISTDKKSYKEGETAKITLQLPRASGQLLYSVNKQIFREIKTAPIEGYIKQIEVPITEGMDPGFYFYAGIFQDEIFAENKLYIEAGGKKLKVEIKPSKDTYAPGEEAELTIKTFNESGSPVSAESSVAVIDKAVLSLMSDQSGDIYDAFYPKPSDSMVSLNSLDVISIFGAEMGGCFTGDTPILMADGSYKKIESVRSGDKILTRESEQSSALAADKVVAKQEHVVGEYLLVNDKLKVTSIHVVYVNGEWKEMGKAKVGDWMYDSKGGKVKIVSIKKRKELVKVYNFQTKNRHTYFAGDFYVHNDKGGGEPRTNFVDTAYWNPYVATDQNGEAKIRFKLPDNLTTWITFVKSVTDDTKAGQQEAEFKTAKNLIIRPILPQFFRSGDEMTISASVHNSLGGKAAVDAKLAGEGVEIVDAVQKQVEAADGGAVPVKWQVKIKNAKEAKLTFSASQAGGSAYDGVELKLPAYSSLNSKKMVRSGSGAVKLDFKGGDKDAKIFDSSTIEINASVLASLPGIIEKLTGYPYGCVEQTMSAHLPNVLVSKNQKILGIEPKAGLNESLNEGFDRLQKYQHDDGGFGWWENDENNVWMSGYVMEGLVEAKEAGLLSGRQAMYDGLLKYLKDNISTFGEEEKYYVTYVLSKAEPGSNKEWAEKYADEILGGKKTDIQSKGYIALALYYDKSEAKAKHLLNRIKGEMKDSHWDLPESYEYWHGSMKDKYSATGLSLLAMIKIDYDEKTAQEIVGWLMRNRNGYEGLWGSTRQSSLILFALIDYVSRSSELSPQYEYSIYLNSKLVKGDKVSDNKYSTKLELPAEEIKDKNVLEIKQTGQGHVYWVFTNKVYVPALAIEQNKGLTIKREYLDAKGNPVKEIKTGDYVKVRFTVDSKEKRNYVMIEDYLPAGLEVQNTRLENVSEEAGEDRWSYWYDSIDIRDQLVAYFIQDLWDEQHTFEYTARATAPGKFSAPAPHIELMYEPQTGGYGQEEKVEIK